MCTFDAEAQEERNGSKWRAVDGSVKAKNNYFDDKDNHSQVIRHAESLQAEGVVSKLDETHGQFGFIKADGIGDVFFNASSVRPPTKDITKVGRAQFRSVMFHSFPRQFANFPVFSISSAFLI